MAVWPSSLLRKSYRKNKPLFEFETEAAKGQIVLGTASRAGRGSASLEVRSPARRGTGSLTAPAEAPSLSLQTPWQGGDATTPAE